MDQPTQIPRYWFPAKRYGWGWSTPAVWQGWAVYAGYLVALVVVAINFRPDAHPVGFFSGVIALSALLLVACWLKGEPPKWRWGK